MYVCVYACVCVCVCVCVYLGTWVSLVRLFHEHVSWFVCPCAGGVEPNSPMGPLLRLNLVCELYKRVDTAGTVKSHWSSTLTHSRAV